MNDRERTDYDANRGPLGRPEYTHRRPDPISTFAGCLVIIVAMGFGLLTLAIIAVTLLHELRFLFSL